MENTTAKGILETLDNSPNALSNYLTTRGSIKISTEQAPYAAGFLKKLKASPDYYFTEIGRGENVVVSACIDGRLPAETASLQLSPNSAGGSLSLWVAHRLTGGKLRTEDFFKELLAAGVHIGDHTDDHAHGESTGCGANDKFSSILGLIADTVDLETSTSGEIFKGIALLREALGLTPQTDTKSLIKAARELFGNAETPLQRMASIEQSGSGPVLTGAHCEVAVIINSQAGTTLNRQRFIDDYEGVISAFNVDAWAFEQSAVTTLKAMGEDWQDGEKVAVMVDAMMAYNLATAATLCGGNIQLVIA